MRWQGAALRAQLKRTVQQKRAELAGIMYGTDTLRARMMEAAGEGRDTVTIPGVAGVELRGTEAATAAEAWLDVEGVAYRWDTRSGHPEGPAVDLVIEWREAALPATTPAGG